MSINVIKLRRVKLMSVCLKMCWFPSIIKGKFTSRNGICKNSRLFGSTLKRDFEDLKLILVETKIDLFSWLISGQIAPNYCLIGKKNKKNKTFPFTIETIKKLNQVFQTCYSILLTVFFFFQLCFYIRFLKLV